MATSVDIQTESMNFLEMVRENPQKQTDSKATRFVRRKFQCIIIFLVLFMTLMESLNVIVPKLSESNISFLNKFLSSTLNKTSREYDLFNN